MYRQIVCTPITIAHAQRLLSATRHDRKLLLCGCPNGSASHDRPIA